MYLKNLLPFENYVLITKLSVEEVLRRLNIYIQPRQSIVKFISRSDFTKTYSGEINGNTFNMIRNINYRNSFLPLIEGQIERAEGSTHIYIKMKLVTTTLVFISIWLGILGLLSVLTIYRVLQYGLSSNSYFSIVMFILGVLIIHFGFKRESKKSKEFLAELLESVD